jgi:hypothetical protein
MALGLYDAAFATLAGLYGSRARGPITGITLIAGFASTIGWPLSAFLDAEIGWRGTCLAWGFLREPDSNPLRTKAHFMLDIGCARNQTVQACRP